MLSIEEIKEIGWNECIEKIGQDLFKKYEEFSCFMWGEYNPGILTCSVGMNKAPSQNTKPMLTSGKNGLISLPAM